MPKRPTIELSNAVHEILNGRGYVVFPGVLSDRPRVSVLGNYTPRFVQPLENLRYGFQGDRFERFSSKLKYLLRYESKSARDPIYPL